MLSARSGLARALAGAAVGVCLVAAGWAQGGRPEVARDPSPEIRALWVLRSSLTSAESIGTLVRSAKRHGFNTLLVQVRGRGDAYYAGSPEPRGTHLSGQPANFDPLAEVLKVAKSSGVRVHAWVNVNLVSSASDLPRSREHLIYRHPEWLMIPRDLAAELARIGPANPAYVEKLARWTRSQSTGVEGLYASPVSRAAGDHLSAVVRGLARRYPLDGVHFDYARYPSDRFDYSRTAIAEFRLLVEPRLPAPLRRELRVKGVNDLFAFPDALPEQWRLFRVARMTTLLARLRDAVKAERPAALVSVAVAADMREALDRRMQDWATWLHRGLIDVVCPMAYTVEPARFAEQVAAARAAAGRRPVWAGIGAYRLSPSRTAENIATARRLGAQGVILFSYDALIEGPQDYLAAVGRAAFGAEEQDGASR